MRCGRDKKRYSKGQCLVNMVNMVIKMDIVKNLLRDYLMGKILL